jgi:hypothetical protein
MMCGARPICSAVVFVLLCAAGSAQQTKPWSAFDQPPLTIISPEEKAISNPPFFHWQALEGAESYQLLVKSAHGETSATVRTNFYTPPEGLVEGIYEFTVSAELKDGLTTQSKRSSVRIEQGAPGVDVDLNRIKMRTGDRVLFARDVVGRISQSTHPELLKYRGQLLEYARRPRHHTMEPLREPERYPGGRWNAELWKKGNTLAGGVEDYVLSRIGAYLISKDATYLDDVPAMLSEVSGWSATGSTGVWENDHSAWSILHVLSVAYDVLRDELPGELRARMREAIVARCKDMHGLLDPFVPKELSSGMMNDPDNNHPWFSAAALGFGGLALLGEEPEAEVWVTYAAQLFHGMFLPRGGAQGGWHEGIDYWSYSLYFVLQFLDAMNDAAGVDLYGHPWMSNTAFFKVYTHPPEGGYVPFGDCKHTLPTEFDRMVMMRFASRYSDPLAAKYVDAISTGVMETRLIYALHWFPDQVPVPDTMNLPKAVNFADVGWIVGNTDVFNASEQILFAMRAGPTFGRGFGHSHADQNHFVVTAGGDKLIWDSGYYDGYLSPHHRHYSRTAQAHNTILIDGVGQLVHVPGLDGKTVEFRASEDRLHVTGDASNPLLYGGRVTKHLRTVDVDDYTSFTIADEIELREPGQVTWLLHSALPWRYEADSRSIEVVGEQYALMGEFVSAEPVSVTLRDKFPAIEGQKQEDAQAFAAKYPPQYTLEWKTEAKVTRWEPELRFSVHRR